MTVSAITKIPTGEWISKSESETFDLGIQIGDQLGGGEIILLNGPLGAGKTLRELRAPSASMRKT